MALAKCWHHLRQEIDLKINVLYRFIKVNNFSERLGLTAMTTVEHTKTRSMCTKLQALPVLLMFSVLSTAVFGQGADNSADLEAAAALAVLLQETQTLQADVEQLTLDQDGREIQEFQARLVLEKPDHFSWEILSPYQELVLTDGERIWRFEEDLEQVSIDPFSNDISRTPVLLLNGDATAIAESYTVSSISDLATTNTRFILKPKAPDSLFERLSLSFSGVTLTEMQFEDSLGQKTSLTFNAMRVNQPIDPAAFIFQMPEGVEVLDNTSL
jgi:outer membrane lipoprotein carrier protein